MKKQWFDVDKAGLGRQAEEQGKARLVAELIQNGLDEPGVTQIAVTLALMPGEEVADLVVADDAPEGFKDLTHAWTLFAPSAKRDNPELRGRFNIGEKLVLAVCDEASISTTKGTVIFDPAEGRRELADKRERGSVFTGRIRMTQEEFTDVCDYLRSLLLPDSIVVTFNGQQILPRKPIHSCTASLETVLANDKGVLRPTVRKTEISLFEVLPGETASLYELGLPVVAIGDKWHVNIQQKVPLSNSRDNVPPRYLKAVRTLILNEMYSRLTEEDANADWVRQAGSDPNCSPDAIKKVLALRFGDKFAKYNPNERESGKRFVAEGGTLVYGPMLSPGEWQNAKKAEAIKSSDEFCPTPKPYSQDKDAQQVQVIPPERWTPGMTRIADYAKLLAKELLDVQATVTFVSTTNAFLACYAAGGDLHFNVFRLGYSWFDQGISEEVDRLLLHELAHEACSDHLDEAYHEGLCKLGACLKRLALEKPEAFRQ